VLVGAKYVEVKLVQGFVLRVGKKVVGSAKWSSYRSDVFCAKICERLMIYKSLQQKRVEEN